MNKITKVLVESAAALSAVGACIVLVKKYVETKAMKEMNLYEDGMDFDPSALIIHETNNNESKDSLNETDDKEPVIEKSFTDDTKPNIENVLSKNTETEQNVTDVKIVTDESAAKTEAVVEDEPVVKKPRRNPRAKKVKEDTKDV